MPTEDITASLGFEVPDTNASLSALETANFRRLLEDVVATFDSLSSIGTPPRAVRSAAVNGWGDIA